MKIRIIALIVAIGFVVAFSPRAYSAPILEGIWETTTQGTWNTPTGDPDGRDAEALFSISDDILRIELTNLATLTDENDELLMGLFFGFTGDLTYPNVALNGGSSLGTTSDNTIIGILDASSDVIDDSPENLNGEFGYLTGINGINGGRGDNGFSSSGLDPDDTDLHGWDGFGVNTIITPADQIITDPGNPLAPNGPDFGIAGLKGWEGSNGLAYIDNSVVITWQGASGYDLDGITQVHFLYGRDYDNVTAPEPATMLLLGSGLIGLGWFGKRRAKKVGMPVSSAKSSFETKDMT